MERSRRDEGNDPIPLPWLPVHQMDQPLTAEPLIPDPSGGELLDLEALDTPTIPGYLMLEEDVSDKEKSDEENEINNLNGNLIILFYIVYCE